ncbi:MAG: O-antigen ligase family protein, partial [Bdellovibrionales bacterium]|nr:O-antigen ligase family protein [Bdellovibrionales bacterium]
GSEVKHIRACYQDDIFLTNLVRLILLIGFAMIFLRMEWLARSLIIGWICLELVLLKSFGRDIGVALSLGSAIALLPVGGSGTLLAFALLSSLFWLRDASLDALKFGMPFLGVLFAWCISLFFIDLQIGSLQSLAENFGGFSDIEYFLRFAAPTSLIAFEAALRWWMIFFLFIMFSRDSVKRDYFFKGLYFSVVAAACLSAVQIFSIYSDLFPNQSSFWSDGNRYAGSFTDPSAFGLFVVLIFPILLSQLRSTHGVRFYVNLGLILAWLFLGAYSGSRSFYAGFLVYIGLYCLLRRDRVVLLGLLAVGAVYCTAVWFGLFDVIVQYSIESQLPRGLIRLAESLNPARALDTFSSRFIFSEVGLRMFFDNLVTGVGFLQYRTHFLSYALQLGHELGVWVDNSNNFYVGILSELGLCGLFALVWSFSNLSIRENLSLSKEFYALCCLLLLLLLGPHTDFDEVALLTAFLLGSVFEIGNFLGREGGVLSHFRGPQMLAFFSTAFVILVVVFSTKLFFSEWGFYGWEKDEHGRYYRWTSLNAQGFLSCTFKSDNAEDIAHPYKRTFSSEILFRAPQSSVSNPLKVDLAIDGKALEPLIFSGSDTIKAGFDCGMLPQVQYRLKVSSSFIPRKHGMGLDSRVLGVQVLKPPELF